ncbi:epidermal growth factor-like protein [Microplitis demolitor]|uniref:epidermal growth factor-like protein n=1 Tax=Microplitis demolitor TaxID=69319 RepID=UPI0004CD3C2D|nr:epidermal growth factor-like protein [Microplitis demolitor]
MFANSLKSVLIFLIAGIYLSRAQQAVKGGYYQQYPQSSYNNTEVGTCYKRVPYHEALATYNRAGNNQGLRPPWNNTYDNGWVTILDCCEGYQRNSISNRCESVSNDCRTGCFGGRCVAGTCTCDPGWYPVEGVCKPICRRPCGENAYCFAPEVCECKLGWEKSSQGICRPTCPGGCVNGDCIAARVCQCHPGYTLNATRQGCDAICEGGCQNGVCTAPGVCACNVGYVNPPRDREMCVPDCGSSCQNGLCVAPGVCNCRPGYRKDPASETCIPECRTPCPINGHCVAPDRCDCYDGYRLDYASNRCVAANSQQGGYQQGGYQQGGYQQGGYQQGGYQQGGYQQGGYQQGGYQQGGYQQGGYRPGNQQTGNSQDCDRPCVNGVCMGFNICSCNDGYVPDPTDSTRTKCIPGCPGGCPNGVCSGPNYCLCKPGYVKERGVKGSQRCVPQNNY